MDTPSDSETDSFIRDMILDRPADTLRRELREDAHAGRSSPVTRHSVERDDELEPRRERSLSALDHSLNMVGGWFKPWNWGKRSSRPQRDVTSHPSDDIFMSGALPTEPSVPARSAAPTDVPGSTSADDEVAVTDSPSLPETSVQQTHENQAASEPEPGAAADECAITDSPSPPATISSQHTTKHQPDVKESRSATDECAVTDSPSPPTTATPPPSVESQSSMANPRPRSDDHAARKSPLPLTTTTSAKPKLERRTSEPQVIPPARKVKAGGPQIGTGRPHTGSRGNVQFKIPGAGRGPKSEPNADHEE